jgi:hypothetical protein
VSVVYRREVATGLDPEAAIVRALRDLPLQAGELWDVGIGHDDECPSLASRRMDLCTCELVTLNARLAA